MSSYGRNFDFRIPPDWDDRFGRHVLGNGSDIPIGAPVVVDTTVAQSTVLTKARTDKLATGAQAKPNPDMGGIAVYEWIDLNQLDPEYFTYSDRSTCPDGKMIQVISGPGVKVVFRNTTDRLVSAGTGFLNSRDYLGRTMVAGMGATPTVALGDYLTPGTGTDGAGYWAEVAAGANAWLQVTGIDYARHEVEATLLF